MSTSTAASTTDGEAESGVAVSSEYSEADEYLYVEARSFEGNDRKRPVKRWVKDCPEGVDPRSVESPYTLTYDETDLNTPYIIVGAVDGYMLDIDVDIGDGHDVTYDGDIDDIRTPKGVFAFRSASGGPHFILKFEREHSNIESAAGVDLQGDMAGSMGVVTSPFHHPGYEITNEPDRRQNFDGVVEDDDGKSFKNGFGVDLIRVEEPAPLGDFAGVAGGDYDGEEWLTADDIANALGHIPTSVGYEKWQQICYAVHDFDSGALGRRLFLNWSNPGPKWDDDSKDYFENFWSRANSGSANGRPVTLGTLIREAKSYGWKCPASPDAWADGGARTGNTDMNTGGGTGITPSAVVAAAGYDPDDKTLAALKDREKAFGAWCVIDASPDEHLFAAQPDGTLYRYNGGVWTDDGEQRLRELAADALGPAYSPKVLTELKERVRAHAPVDRADMGVPSGTRAVENGLLDLDTWEIRELRPEDRALTRLPVAFDPTAESPAWLDFVAEVVPDRLLRSELIKPRRARPL